MEKRTNKEGEEEEVEDGKKFAEFYADLLEKHADSFAYYLAENAVLDWFGQTVKGVKNISVFVKNNVGNIRHLFPNVELCSDIGFRETHVIKTPATHQPHYPIRSQTEQQEKTPPNTILSPGGSRKREQGQGDGLHNCNNESPLKRTKLGDSTETTAPLKVQNITSDGHIEFRRKSSKKFQRETRWSRPCKFQASYSQTPSGYVIHLMIYQGNLKCRRNLLKDFEAGEPKE